MEKSRIDELYHLLREASNETTILPSTIYGLSEHLFAGGNYLRLVQYCAFYGEQFLLKPTFEAIKEKGWKPQRIVEFGAGLGWLGRGIAARFHYLPAMFIDKRQWTMIDVVADLETDEGIDKIRGEMKSGDLIVMSDFLHCLEDPKKILTSFPEYPMAILDYIPENKDYAQSFRVQLKRYGGNPISAEEVVGMIGDLGRKVDIKDLEPYILMLIDKKE